MLQNININTHIIAGDFNIDLINLDSSSEEYLNNYLESGFLPYFNKVTKPNVLDHSRGTCIDNIFVKTNLTNIKSIKYMNMLPDQFLLFLAMKIEKNKISDNSGYCTKINYNKLVKLGKSWN